MTLNNIMPWVLGILLFGCKCSTGDVVDPSGTGGMGGTGGDIAGEAGDGGEGGGSPCDRACRTLQGLSCEEGKPTPEGESCNAVCENGMETRYNLFCVARIKKCDGISDCEY